MSLLYKEVDDFEVYAYHQKQFKKVTKKDLLGKWTLFFFYPADFTFVCPTELEDLQEKYQEFKKVNCEIYAISTDTHFAHKTWHDISENMILKVKSLSMKSMLEMLVEMLMNF